jgi:two-component system, OmpR family, sensor histidine kinase CiaH
MKKNSLKINRKLTAVKVVYWALLIYMIAALLWWFIALVKQNDTLVAVQLQQITGTQAQPTIPKQTVEQLLKMQSRKRVQYIAEGLTFLALILVGAVYVYRATRRQIRASVQEQNFMMAVTHELKTPIAVTQLNLETLQKRKLVPAQQDKMIASTLREANRLNMLCDNILLASQLDGKAYQETRTEINFSDLLEGCIDTFKQHYPSRLVTEQIEPTLYLDGETLLLQMLVNNLLENAHKYAPQDTEIKVTLAQQGKHIKLEVIDSGKGIPDNEKQKIFEKFYRIGSEATRNTKGTGLGLYLCKKIAENHNANISVTDSKPQGSNFVVTFNS